MEKILLWIITGVYTIVLLIIIGALLSFGFNELAPLFKLEPNSSLYHGMYVFAMIQLLRIKLTFGGN